MRTQSRRILESAKAKMLMPMRSLSMNQAYSSQLQLAWSTGSIAVTSNHPALISSKRVCG